MNKKAGKGFVQCSDADKAQLLRTFTQWCEGYSLPDGKHKRNEGRATQGERSALRQAFAASAVRLYGWVETIAGVETFVLVDYDLNKKRQRADQALLAEVGRKIFALQDLMRNGDQP